MPAPSTNAEVARILFEIADLLELAGERFKPEAYRRAARSVETLSEDLSAVARRGELRSVPCVGEAIEEKIGEYLRDGRIAYYDRIRTQFPAGVVDLMHLPGIGPKTARRFLLEFGVEGPAELLKAIDDGRLAGARGFGPRKIELLREAVASASTPARRIALLDARRTVERLLAAIRSGPPVDRVEVAGSYRRARETVGDLDFLATSSAPPEVLAAFGRLPDVRSVTMSGTTKATVILSDGLQVDLRVVDPASFGAALQYFTGSKDHNVHLRSIARDRGLKINEYGVFRGEERVAGATEEEVYRTLKLPYIPPEIREDRGEIDAAASGKLPKLLERDDLKGDLHVHLEEGLGADALQALAAAAERRGLRYLGVVAPEDAGDLADVARRLANVGGATRLVLAVERPLGRSGGLPDFPEEAEVAIVAVDGRDVPARSEFEAPGIPLLLGHLRAEGARDGSSGSLGAAWAQFARSFGGAVDVTPRPGAEGLDAGGVRGTVEAGGRIHVSSGATSSDGFADLEVALGLARRGWATPEHVLNASALRGRTGRGRSK